MAAAPLWARIGAGPVITLSPLTIGPRCCKVMTIGNRMRSPKIWPVHLPVTSTVTSVDPLQSRRLQRPTPSPPRPINFHRVMTPTVHQDHIGAMFDGHHDAGAAVRRLEQAVGSALEQIANTIGAQHPGQRPRATRLADGAIFRSN